MTLESSFKTPSDESFDWLKNPYQNFANQSGIMDVIISNPEANMKESMEKLDDATSKTKDIAIDAHDVIKGRLEFVENAFKNASEKWERERQQQVFVMTKKNELVDTMRVKLNRYEFAIKEAMLFLAKPMEGYTAWLAMDPSKSVNFKDRNPSETKVTPQATPAQLAQKQQHLDSIQESTSPSIALQDIPAPETITAEDIPALECIRLSLNYLRNAQTSVHALTIYKAPAVQVQPSSPDIMSPYDPMEHVPLSVDTTQPPNQHVRQESDFLNAFGKEIAPTNPNATEQLLQEIATRHRAESNFSTNTKVVEEKDEGDLAFGEEDEGTSSFNQASPTPRKNLDEKKCDNCHDLMLRIDHFQDQTMYLKRDVMALVTQLNEERSCRQRVQLSKDILDQELEELTSQLFDQANKMVIDEATLREQIENLNHELEGELKDLTKKFETREDELKDLKRCLVALDAAKQRSTSFASSPRESLVIDSSSPTRQALHPPVYFHSNPASFFSSRVGPHSNVYPFIPVDGIFLKEFQDYIKTTTTLSLPSAQQHSALMQTAFMKRCLLEDIEPCLYYSYANHTNSIKASSMSSSFRKRLLDGVAFGTCDIKMYWSSKETLYLANASDETPSQSQDPDILPACKKDGTPTQTPQKGPPKKKCNGCGLTRECDYRIRFTGGTVPGEWNQICRFCRDRIACVTDFFTFMSHIRAQGGSTGILGMFRHMLWLKRRMAVSRVGCCSLFEGEVVAALERGGSGGQNHTAGDWEKLVQVIN